MNVLIVDGHPDQGRLVGALLDHYAGALAPETEVTKLALRDLTFDPNQRRGYAEDQAWEPDLEHAAGALDRCDHLVVGFPLWWGAEPMVLKGFLDRMLLPGFAFKYRQQSPFWDRLLAGRSADVLITMDTPPWYLRTVYGDAVARRWRLQVLGFVGFKPVRVLRMGPTRRGGAARQFEHWQARIARAAASAARLRRADKHPALAGRAAYLEAVRARRS